MPGILHTHLWGADNSSLSLWKQPLGCSLLLESAASCRARRCFALLILPLKDFGAGDEVASDALRCLQNN